MTKTTQEQRDKERAEAKAKRAEAPASERIAKGLVGVGEYARDLKHNIQDKHALGEERFNSINWWLVGGVWFSIIAIIKILAEHPLT